MADSEPSPVRGERLAQFAVRLNGPLATRSITPWRYLRVRLDPWSVALARQRSIGNAETRERGDAQIAVLYWCRWTWSNIASAILLISLLVTVILRIALPMIIGIALIQPMVFEYLMLTIKISHVKSNPYGVDPRSMYPAPIKVIVPALAVVIAILAYFIFVPTYPNGNTMPRW